MAVGPATAIKQFFEKDSVRGPISTAELMTFKRACSAEEWNEFAQSAAKQMGLELTAAA